MVQLGLNGTAGGGRQRGAAVFGVRNEIGRSDGFYPRVAIAGTSSQQHPSTAGFAVYGGGVSGGGGGARRGAYQLKPTHSSYSSHSPVHRRSSSRSESNRYKVGPEAGVSMSLVPAEAESSPPLPVHQERMEDDHPRGGGLVDNAIPLTVLPAMSLEEREGGLAASARGGVSSRSKPKRSKRSSRSSKRHSVGDGGSRKRRGGGEEGYGGMVPAMPLAGPYNDGRDEMRPSPGPHPAPSGPWIS